jgi:uncharacterized membrane protein YeaQ/YmgE (transglycosylase-associated protein family)
VRAHPRHPVRHGPVESFRRAAEWRLPTGQDHLSARRKLMNIILIIIIGGILGWLASMVMRTDAQQGIFLNIVVGVVGALLAGFLINPLIGGGNITAGDFSISALIVSFLGALVLLAIVNLFRRGSVR